MLCKFEKKKEKKNEKKNRNTGFKKQSVWGRRRREEGVSVVVYASEERQGELFVSFICTHSVIV